MKKFFLIFTFVCLISSNTVLATEYYVSTTGNDTNNGLIASPWKTIQKAVDTVIAGDTIFVRGGQYNGVDYVGWYFKNSGTKALPITLTNYAGEQAVFKINTVTASGSYIFKCFSYDKDNPQWQTPKADYIRIIGSDVTTRTLSNGVASKKGIVMLGAVAQQAPGIAASDCDNWEVAGVDFVEVAYGIFTHKSNYGTMTEHSTDSWYVHDNRVYNFYRESGVQFNGNFNRIENNEIYKVSNRLDTPFGCQMLNLLGNNNSVKNNRFSRLGSTAQCEGILFEWDLSDANIIEQNLIYDVPAGISIQGGDSNIIRNNTINQSTTPDQWTGGVQIFSYDNTTKTDWPCDESTSSAQGLVPANNPAHPDYKYYYSPRNCLSSGNQIYNNTINGFVEGVRIYPLTSPNTIIKNNIFSNWSRGSICFYKSSDGTCKALTTDVVASYNLDGNNVTFVDALNNNFQLKANSPACTAGEGGTYVGAYPCSATPTVAPTIKPTVAPTAIPTVKPTIAPTLIPTKTPTPTPLISDKTAPIVKIISPKSGATVTRSKTTTINATATDNVKVIKMEYLINNVVKCSFTSVKSCSWSVPSTRSASYTITVKAYDAANNKGVVSLLVKSSK